MKLGRFGYLRKALTGKERDAFRDYLKQEVSAELLEIFDLRINAIPQPEIAKSKHASEGWVQYQERKICAIYQKWKNGDSNPLPKPTSDRILAVFIRNPDSLLTIKNVADLVGVKDRTAYHSLRKLARKGLLYTKSKRKRNLYKLNNNSRRRKYGN